MVCAALAATVVSCRHEMPLQYMAGVVEAVTPSSLTVRSIAGDSVLMFVVDEATERSGGDAIEGNAVEVCYRGSHDSPELTALSVTGNETYTDVLGRWATGRRAELPVEIELLPGARCGRRRRRRCCISTAGMSTVCRMGAYPLRAR